MVVQNLTVLIVDVAIKVNCHPPGVDPFQLYECSSIFHHKD